MRPTPTTRSVLLIHTPLRAVIFALLFCFSLMVQGTEQHPLKEDNLNTLTPPLTQPLGVAFTEFPPITYTDEHGIAQGYFIELIKNILDEMQLPYSLISRPTARIYYQLKTGEVDIWLGPLGVPNIQEHVRETPLPEKYSVNLSFWRKLGTPGVADEMDLQGQSLAIINGFTYAGFINKLTDPAHNIQLIRTSNHSNAFKMLVSGRVDYLLDYEQPVNTLLKEHPSTKLLKHTFQNNKVGFMVSRNIPHSVSLHKALSDAIDKRYPQKKQ